MNHLGAPRSPWSCHRPFHVYSSVQVDIAEVPCMPMCPGAPCVYLGTLHASFWEPLGPPEVPRVLLGTSWGLPRDPLGIPGDLPGTLGILMGHVFIFDEAGHHRFHGMSDIS